MSAPAAVAASIEAAVRSRRLLTNAAIAARDAAGLNVFLEPDVRLIGADGTLILGAEAVRKAFEERFADPTFVTFWRATDSVLSDRDGGRAAEWGRWTGLWRGPDGAAALSGPYMAVWRGTGGLWRLESELYFLGDRTET